MSKRARQARGSSSRGPQPENFAETVHSWGIFTEDATAVKYTQLLGQHVEHGTVIDWSFLQENGLEQGFVNSFSTDGFTGPQWDRLFRIREPVYDELVREFFASFRFDAAEAREDVGRTMIYFRLGGEWRTCSVMEFGWRLGLYEQYDAAQGEFMQRLQHGETVRNELECIQFWPNIGVGVYTPTTGAAQIRDPRVRLTRWWDLWHPVKL